MSEPVRLDTRLDRLWREYVTTAKRAQERLDREEMMRAGRIWSQLMDEFRPPAERWPRDPSGRMLTPSEIRRAKP